MVVTVRNRCQHSPGAGWRKKKLAISISSWMLNEFYAMCEVPVLNVQFVLVTGEII